MRILLYAIFTNEYTKLIKPWLETTAKNFYPNNTDVLVITDNPNCIEDRRNIIVKTITSHKNRHDELCLKCKRHLEVLEEYKDSYDFFAAIQGNCLLIKEVNEDNFPLPKDKLSVFQHTCTGFRDILNDNVCKVGSCGYRSLHRYDNIYTHAGMTFGNYDVMTKMNQDCYNFYLTDYNNDRLHRVPYHDESYINTWRVDNKELVNVLPRINSGYLKDIEKFANPFYLVDKDNLGVNKNHYVCPKFVPNTRLGNWLFLIATCYAHAQRNGYDMKLPYKKELPFSIRKNFAIELPKDIKAAYQEPTYHYTPIPPTAKGYFSGFFQSSKYFNDYKDEIKELYKEFISDKKKEGVAGIHVRMGDYLKLSQRFKSPTKDFIERAIKELSPHIKRLLVFSDEMDKAVELVKTCKGSERFTITPSNDMCETNEIYDLYFMTSCEEFIMSCSSFSWWAAYLGEHKKVIVDKKWYNDNQLNEKDLYEDSWIRI